MGRAGAYGRAGGILASAMAVLLILVSPTAAQAPPSETAIQSDLARTQQELAREQQRRAQADKAARSYAQQRAKLQQQMVALAATIQETEKAAAKLALDQRRLQDDAAARRAALEGRRAELGAMLGGLQRLALHPPDAMIALPQPPLDTVHGAILLGATLPALNERVAAVAAQLADLARVDAELQARRAEAGQTATRLKGQRADLDRLIAEKQTLERNAQAESRRIAARADKLAATAHDLRDLLDRLAADRAAEETRRAEEARQAEAQARAEAERQAQPAPSQEARLVPPPSDLAPGPRGGRTLPAVGRIATAFGQTNDFGQPARGITIETSDLAEVVAPAGGHVLFAGPFRGYGQILIIEHGDGYHSLVAGFGRIDATTGQTVAAGEPIGIMGRAADHQASLYYELRHNGQPVNPQPWLAAERAR